MGTFVVWQNFSGNFYSFRAYRSILNSVLNLGLTFIASIYEELYLYQFFLFQLSGVQVFPVCPCDYLDFDKGFVSLIYFSVGNHSLFHRFFDNFFCFCVININHKLDYFLLSPFVAVISTLCSRTFKCTVKLLVGDHSNIFM